MVDGWQTWLPVVLATVPRSRQQDREVVRCFLDAGIGVRGGVHVLHSGGFVLVFRRCWAQRCRAVWRCGFGRNNVLGEKFFYMFMWRSKAPIVWLVELRWRCWAQIILYYFMEAVVGAHFLTAYVKTVAVNVDFSLDLFGWVGSVIIWGRRWRSRQFLWAAALSASVDRGWRYRSR